MKPDLYDCTRLEIEFELSGLDQYFATSDDAQNLLNRAERQSLASFKKVVCEDRESIKAFAHDLRSGCYWGPVEGYPAYKGRIDIVAYRGAQRVTSLVVIGTHVRTEDGHEFLYETGFPHSHLLAPALRPFELRATCADNVRALSAYLPVQGGTSYPDPREWCDAIMRKARQHDLDRDYPMSPFECPGARTCHYAMNSNCRHDSRGDMVLLFETKPGWNQHGGPELFTFDNHGPRGGLVRLKDGTVKFIRTEEELKQLRWK